MSKVVRVFEQWMDDFTRDLGILVSLESPSADKGLLNKLAYQAASMCETAGLSVNMVPGGDYGDHVIASIGDQGPQVLVLCHMDTVFPQGEIQRRPWCVSNGVARGPGVYDMKCGIVQALYAIKYLAEYEPETFCSRRVCLILNSDEEIGSPSSRGIILDHAAQSKCALVLEPSIGGSGRLKTSRSGVGCFRIEAEGIASHAGSEHSRGASAVREICRHVVCLEDLTDYAIGTTLNAGLIGGGTASNVVAAVAWAEVDVRVRARVEADRIERILMSLEPVDSRVRLNSSGGYNRLPMEDTPANQGLFRLAQDVALNLGFNVEGGWSGAGSDGNLTSAVGCPTLDGLGAVGDGAHATTEHVLLKDVPRRTALLAKLIKMV